MLWLAIVITSAGLAAAQSTPPPLPGLPQSPLHMIVDATISKTAVSYNSIHHPQSTIQVSCIASLSNLLWIISIMNLPRIEVFYN